MIPASHAHANDENNMSTIRDDWLIVTAVGNLDLLILREQIRYFDAAPSFYQQWQLQRWIEARNLLLETTACHHDA